MTYCPHCGEKTWTDGRGCEGGGCGADKGRMADEVRSWRGKRIEDMTRDDLVDALNVMMRRERAKYQLRQAERSAIKRFRVGSGLRWAERLRAEADEE